MSETIHRPQDEGEAADMLKAAHDARTPMQIAGGGTRGTHMTNAAQLSSSGLAGIVDYEPAELVMIVRAGTPMATIDAALDAHRQRLIFEPMDHRPLLGISLVPGGGEPTIGGAIATNASGPRRFTAGAARDSLFGLRFVNGAGEVVKAGGRVMKNVTGLDLPKLLAGSHGTLGLMTEISVKVWPKVETERTLRLPGLSPERAAQAMATAMATSAEVTGAAHLPMGGGGADGPATCLRIEGFADSVTSRIDMLRKLLSGFADADTLDDDDSAALWRSVRDVTAFADGTDRPVWKVSLPPMAGHAFAARFEGDTVFDWQGGLVWLRLAGSDAQAEAVRQAATELGGHATLMRGEAEAPRFHPQPAAVEALSRRVKAQFDPAGILQGELGR